VRIAHFGSKGLPYQGGTEQVVEAIATRQSTCHSVTVYGNANLCSSVQYRGVRVLAMPSVRGKHIGPALSSLGAALHALFAADYDVVHVHGGENAFIVPLLRLRYPVVTTNHGPAHQRAKWGRVARSLMRSMDGVAVRRAVIPTAVAEPHAVALGRRYHRSVRYIPNGFDPCVRADRTAGAALLDQWGLADRDYWLFAAGRVDPTKGCHTLIDAYARLEGAPPLLVLGDMWHAAGYEENLRRLANGLDVRFVPRVTDRAAFLAVISMAQLFVFPSLVEAMSIVLLEALSLGTPVVASDIPENTAVLPRGVSTFRAGDSLSLASCLQDVMTQSPEANRSRAADFAPLVQSRFDWSAIARSYESVYREAIATPRAKESG
jgi:glycosyltransferase involved in cell wall biosynthesis